MPTYTLYGADISYYTGKVRAYLRWKSIPFTEVTASADIYREVILPRVGFPVIPVLVTPAGETLQDTSDIIDTIEQRQRVIYVPISRCKRFTTGRHLISV